MADGFMDRIDDGLSVGSYCVRIVIEIENPAECLPGGRDVIALRAEHHDRRSNVTKVYGPAIAGLDHAGRELIPNEQLIDDELDFLGIEIDMGAPPAFEAEIAWGLGVDLGIEIVLLAP